MSGAARVNEPFPGLLVAEYYIDNRNYLPSTRDGWQDVSFGTLIKKRNREDPSRSTAIDTHASERYLLLFRIINVISILHGIWGPYFVYAFLLISTRASPRIDLSTSCFLDLSTHILNGIIHAEKCNK